MTELPHETWAMDRPHKEAVLVATLSGAKAFDVVERVGWEEEEGKGGVIRDLQRVATRWKCGKSSMDTGAGLVLNRLEMP